MDRCIEARRHTNSSTSPLIKLPKRLKEKIYAYVLVIDRPIELNRKSVQRYMSLLKVCAQIRRNATPIFYSKNTFRISNIFSAAKEFLKHARGSVPKLLISFEATPNKLKTWDYDDRSALKLYIPCFAERLLVWDVNPKAVFVERPGRGRVPLDSVRHDAWMNKACDEFEYLFRNLASPQRAGYIMELKDQEREEAEKARIARRGLSQIGAKGTPVKHKGASFCNARGNGQSAAMEDESTILGKGKNNRKNQKKQEKLKAKKAARNAENEDS